MKNSPINRALFFLLLSSVLLTNLQAAAALLPAAPSKYVTDNASVLKANTAERLSGQLADFDHRTADELIIVIDPNLPKGVSIGEYARQLYNGWKIGKRGKDTGALLLICTQERQGRIDAGQGWRRSSVKMFVRKSSQKRSHPALMQATLTAPARLR